MLIVNNLPQMHLKLVKKKARKKTVEATDDLIANKTANKITGVSKSLPQHNSVKIKEGILRER